MIKKFFSLLLPLLFLASCGKAASPDIGVYTCEQIIKGEEKLSVSDYYSSPPKLTLAEKNRATLEINGEVCGGTWKNDNGEFSLFTGDKLSSGTIGSGKCTVDLFHQGILYGFFSDSFSVTDQEEKEKEKEKNNRWNGDWYGYWTVQNASGQWESYDGRSLDCFAHIDMSQENTGEIKLWDEQSSSAEPLGAVRLKLTPSSALYGTASSESGFFFSADIEEGEWTIEPDKEKLENVLSFSSHYSAQDGEFDYMFVLRPWGTIWDDAIESGAVRLPYFYNRWYLPMLSGNSPMPDSFEP